MIFKNFANQDWIAFNFIRSGLDSDWEISQSAHLWRIAEVAGVTFSDSDSTSVPKFLHPGPAILQIWESNTCSDSGYNHRSNRNFPMFLPKKWPHRLLLLPKRKIDSGSGSGVSQIFDSGSESERKTQNPAGIDSGNPDLVPPLTHRPPRPQN